MLLRRAGLLWSALVVAFIAAAHAAGCATGNSGSETGEDDPPTYTGSEGGQSSGTGGGYGGSGGAVISQGGTGQHPCGIDCSTIETDACHVAECNLQTGVCALANAPDGTECDDEEFCTIDDVCDDGDCVGGGQNDCDLPYDPCLEVVCDEGDNDCSQIPAADGTYCIPDDLCEVNGQCKYGSCVGQPKDCSYQPVPNECYKAVCNTLTGDCDPVPDPLMNGQACSDLGDLCTVGKTCTNGNCVGGYPLDCSHLSQGCFDGVCNPSTGSCESDPVPPGSYCAEVTNDCNQGECDITGQCIPLPTNQGGPCNSNHCLVGQTCNDYGQCQGGVPIVNCVPGDLCCPPGCNEITDPDCLTEIIMSALTDGFNGNLGGVAGADALCNQQATLHGHPGTWRAFLSSSTQQVKDFFTGTSASTISVVTTTGEVMFNSWEHIFQIGTGSWLTSSDLIAFDGKEVDEGTGANPEWSDADGWTGSLADGTTSTMTCSDWTSSLSTVKGQNGEWDFYHELLLQESAYCSTFLAVACVRIGP